MIYQYNIESDKVNSNAHTGRKNHVASVASGTFDRPSVAKPSIIDRVSVLRTQVINLERKLPRLSQPQTHFDVGLSPSC